MSNTSATGGYLVPTSAPPAEDAALDDIFTELVAGVTGLAGTLVRPRWQPKPPRMPDPTTDWCAVGVIEYQPDANAVVAHDGDANGGLGEDDLQRQEDLTVMASFYGPNANGFAKMARDGLSIPQNWETIAQSDISYVSAGTIRSAPELVNEQWLRRFDLTLYFRRRIVRSYAVENLASADIAINDVTITVSV